MALPTIGRFHLSNLAKELFCNLPKQSLSTWLVLMKLTIPAMLIVRLLMLFGLTPYLSRPFEPLMLFLGLPRETALVWVTGMLTTTYTAIIVLINLLPSIGSMDVAQCTILGSLILISHSLPVESSICGGAGVSPLRVTILRLLAAIMYGYVLNLVFSLTGWGQDQGHMVIQISMDPLPPWNLWLQDSIKSVFLMFVIIYALLLLMGLFKKIGLLYLISLALEPLLKLAGIGPRAIMVTVIGNVMGLSYGGGLIIAESHSGKVPTADIYGSIVLMAICHSLIEDTLIMASIGGSFWGLLWGRLIFALILTGFITRAARHPGLQNLLIGRKYSA